MVCFFEEIKAEIFKIILFSAQLDPIRKRLVNMIWKSIQPIGP